MPINTYVRNDDEVYVYRIFDTQENTYLDRTYARFSYASSAITNTVWKKAHYKERDVKIMAAKDRFKIHRFRLVYDND